MSVYQVGMTEDGSIPSVFTTVPSIKDAARTIQRYLKGAAERMALTCTKNECGVCGPCQTVYAMYRNYGPRAQRLIEHELNRVGQFSNSFGAVEILALRVEG